MRTSRILLATEREDPSDAEIVSHRLMIRAGLVRRLAAGLYTWLPLGLRVLRKIENIVREEMDRAGAQEVLMPAVQPAELWMESGRWDHFGPELLRLRDRHERDFCVGPTHEEVITDIVRREVRSYRQLPLNLYQIQTKFRDEVRPRFGVMRAREFIMKDAYSFDLDEAGSLRSYETMRDAYRRIFSRTGLDFRVVEADSGAIGGSRSEEFHVLAESGEDDIAFNDEGTYAANLELTPAPSPPAPAAATETMREVRTPDVRTIEDVSELLRVPPGRCLKTLFVEGDDGPIALVLRGDHELNLVKASRLEGVRTPVALASPEAVREATGAGAGSVGPVGLGVPVVADHWAAAAADFVCGANRDETHLAGVNWGRDLPRPATADLRNAIEGDPSPDGRGTISIRRGIEVGHVFQLGRKYSESMHAVCLDEGGRAPHPRDGLLRNRGEPHRRRRHRAEPRRERHRLAGRHRPVRGGATPAERPPLPPGCATARKRSTRSFARSASRCSSTIGRSGPGSCSRRRISSASPTGSSSGNGGSTRAPSSTGAGGTARPSSFPSTRRWPWSPPASTAARPDRREALAGPKPHLALRDAPREFRRHHGAGAATRRWEGGGAQPSSTSSMSERTNGIVTGRWAARECRSRRSRSARRCGHVPPLARHHVGRHRRGKLEAAGPPPGHEHLPELRFAERGEGEDRPRGEPRGEVRERESETPGRRPVRGDQGGAGALEGVEETEQGLLPFGTAGGRADSVEADEAGRLQPFGHPRPHAGLSGIEVEALRGAGGRDQQVGLAGAGGPARKRYRSPRPAADARTA